LYTYALMHKTAIFRMSALQECWDNPIGLRVNTWQTCAMSIVENGNPLAKKYDRVAGAWHDKMRTLGYFDAYLGFLCLPDHRPPPDCKVIDFGAGTAAFSEAWVAVHGAPRNLLLVDLSAAMLERGKAFLARRGVDAQTRVAAIDETTEKFAADEVLVAHLIEHLPDALSAIKAFHSHLAPGGRLRLVVSKPHWCNALIWLRWRHRSFASAEVRSLLLQAGFEIETEYAFPSGVPSRTSRGYIARRV